MNIMDEIKASFKTGSTLTRLIYVNLGVFLLIQIAMIFLHLFNAGDVLYEAINWLGVPWDLHTLISRPWTIITYMFVHENFLHILFNLLWLYWFGKIFLSYLSERQLLSVYILGGIAGALLYIISYNIFPGLYQQNPAVIAIGASAAIMAIVIAIGTLMPDYKIYIVFLGPVKIIYVALAGFILSSLLDFSVNTGGKIAHIGGAAFGYFFTIRYKNGRDITMGFSRFIDRIFYIFRPRKKMRVTHKRTVSDDLEYNRMKMEKQQEIDRILDKISKKGYDSLSAEEKETLFKMNK
ncbi:MAG TPA: rhomboid family intramembrane serine protease [Bacteroidales bacterium]|nr:rhomboid family intramembrane serine protease [Bacteroidales bacterium]